MIQSGTRFYYRKVRLDLEGGPSLNMRSKRDLVSKRRSKAGAAKDWYARRRGGQEEVWKKTDPEQQRYHGGRVRQQPGQEHQRPRPTSSVQGGGDVQLKTGEPQEEQQLSKEVTAILLVPYTLGSVLRDLIQRKDKEFVTLVGGGKSVRVVENGGSKLINTLGRNDPWSADRSCSDVDCVPCGSRRWIREQKKLAKSRGQKLPDKLLTMSSNQCRREGCNYTLQCLVCLELGHQAL